MDENKLKELKKILVYDRETGLFYKKLKSGTLKPTGSYSGGENGHIVIRVFGLNIKAHRLAWFFEYKEFPEFPIGHKNGIKTDNRPQNLIKIEKGKGIDPDTEINSKIFLKKFWNLFQYLDQSPFLFLFLLSSEACYLSLSHFYGLWGIQEILCIRKTKLTYEP